MKFPFESLFQASNTDCGLDFLWYSWLFYQYTSVYDIIVIMAVHTSWIIDDNCISVPPEWNNLLLSSASFAIMLRFGLGAASVPTCLQADYGRQWTERELGKDAVPGKGRPSIFKVSWPWKSKKTFSFPRREVQLTDLFFFLRFLIQTIQLLQGRRNSIPLSFHLGCFLVIAVLKRLWCDKDILH